MGENESRVKKAVVTELQPFPEQLKKLELQAVQKRRLASGVDPTKPLVGIGVSGGGIRSATFALGLFQSIARAKLLHHLDYLSTVSGGGYFGAFLGTLYVRAERNGTNAVGVPEQVAARLSDNDDPAIKYLRENGRYLAPGGTSDLLLGGAVLLRNWVALQVMLACFVVMTFLAAETLLLFIFAWTGSLAEVSANVEEWLWKQGVWLSPWLVLSPLVLLIAGLPLGWSYWTLGRGQLPRWLGKLRKPAEFLWTVLPSAVVIAAGAWFVLGIPPWLGATAVWVATLSLTMVRRSADTRLWVLWLPYILGLSLAGMWFLWLERLPMATSISHTQGLLGWALVVLLFNELLRFIGKPELNTSGTSAESSADSRARHRVSTGLRSVLVSCAVLLGFALVETLGRSVYANVFDEEGLVAGVSGGILALLWTAATFARKVVVNFASKTDGKRPRAPLALLAWLGAAVLVVVVLGGGAVAAQAIVWQGDMPKRVPSFATRSFAQTETLLESAGPGAPIVELVLRYPAVATTSSTVPAATSSSAARQPPASRSQPTLGENSDGEISARDASKVDDTDRGIRKNVDLFPDALRALWFTLAAFVASVLFGSSRVFLNRSTHLPLYSARLTRAYLGASNPERFKRSGKTSRCDAGSFGEPDPQAATRVMQGDDVASCKYWGWGWDGEEPAPPSAHWANGAPLHIVNVTINETVDGRSQVQQGDRKGLGLALGPCAISAGVRHHLLPGQAQWLTYAESDFYVFRFPTKPAGSQGTEPAGEYPRDQLTLGQWTSISGAAFSTGLGSRTNQGLSLLAGFTNVRLGHWWRPGIEWCWSLRRALGSVFWVQTYLFREMFARFPGAQNSLWYLSDGGHFENMGGYELIRRRLAFMVIVDGEADPDYQFEGLGNLVRKARIDFGAEIEFVTDPLACLATGSPSLPLGPLSHLRRGKWEQSGGEWTFEATDTGGRSLARAALATVRYVGENPAELRWLLYVKPTLLGLMPADLEHYSSQQQQFPNESTGDQFFDEAQWESYRKLGELTGNDLFRTDEKGEPRLDHEGELARLLVGVHPILAPHRLQSVDGVLKTQNFEQAGATAH